VILSHTIILEKKVNMVIFYTMPSLVSLSLERLLASGCPPDSDLKPLPPHLKDSLRRVLLKRGRVTGPQLSCLLHPGVTELDLGDCVITPGHLAAMASECVSLRSVSLNQLATNHYEEGDESEENDDDVMINRHVSKILMRNKFLTHLNLRHLRGVRDSGLQCVSRSLTHVDLGGCLRVSDSGVRRLASCPRLSSLSLSRTLITDRSLCSLSSGKCRNSLGELRVNGCVNITDSGIEVSHTHRGH